MLSSLVEHRGVTGKKRFQEIGKTARLFTTARKSDGEHDLCMVNSGAAVAAREVQKARSNCRVTGPHSLTSRVSGD